MTDTQQDEEIADYNTTSASSRSADVFNRTKNHKLKANAILRVAAQAFVEKGYNQTSVADIADRLNISKPTLYYYVGNKEAILLKCQLMAIDNLIEKITKVAEQDLNGLDSLKQFMLGVGEWIASEFAQCIARCQLDLLDSNSKNEVLAGRRSIDRAVRGIIERGIHDGSIRKCNPQTTAAALFGAFNWMAHWYDHKHATKSLKEIGDEFMFVFINGLGMDTSEKQS